MGFLKPQASLNAIVLSGGQNVFGKAFYGFTLDPVTGRLQLAKITDGSIMYAGSGDLVNDSDYSAIAYTLNKLIFSFSEAGHLQLEVR